MHHLCPPVSECLTFSLLKPASCAHFSGMCIARLHAASKLKLQWLAWSYLLSGDSSTHLLRRAAHALQVSDAGVFALQALTGLQRLTMAGCGGIGNGAVGALGGITSLQHLDLHWCSFGDKGMPHALKA